MKRKILMTAAGCLLLLCFANAQNTWKKDSTWTLQWWDSNGILWHHYLRTIRNFNSAGNIVNTLDIRWDNTLSWVPSINLSTEYYPDNTTPKKKVRTTWDQPDQTWVEIFHEFYQSDGRITEKEEKSYNASTNSYTAGFQFIYTYTEGSMQRVIKEYDKGTTEWRNKYRTTTIYDGQGNAINILDESWDTGLSSWVDVKKQEMTYNQEGQIIEALFLSWDHEISDWMNESRMTYSYNELGWLVDNITYLWYNSPGVWINSTKVVYDYDENGSKTQVVNYDWYGSPPLWNYKEKEVYSYYPDKLLHETSKSAWIKGLGQFKEFEHSNLDENGNETELWKKWIDYQTGQFYDGFLIVNSYSDSLRVEARFYILDILTNEWLPLSRYTNTWDENRNLAVELSEEYESDSQTWVNKTKYEHFYSPCIGMDEIPGLSGLCYFQNPISPSETVQCPGLKPDEIYHFRLVGMQGQTILNKTIQGNETLVIPENLATGTYILTIYGQKGTFATGKVIVVK